MYTLRDILEMLSEDNMYYASQSLGRCATPAEAVFHWIRMHPLPPHVTEFHVPDEEEGWLFT